GGNTRLTLLQVQYAQGDPEVYLLPLATCGGADAEALLDTFPGAVVARVRNGQGGEEVLFDAVASERFAGAILEAIARQRVFRGVRGELEARATPAFEGPVRDLRDVEPSPARVEQSNSAITYGERFILKLFRRPEAGINPDIEIGRHLTERGFPNAPALYGTIEYRSAGEVRGVGVLNQFVPKAEDAFQHALGALGRYYERVLRYVASQREAPDAPAALLQATRNHVPDEVVETIGTYLESARLL